MSIEVDGTCDECGDSVGDGDTVYCDYCYQELVDKIEDLENQVSDLEEEIVDLEEKVKEVKNA